MEYIAKSAIETQRVGEEFGAYIVNRLQGIGDSVVVALEGELGSGKTTFVQGLARGLGIEGRIISPTFIIMRKYDAGDRDFYHVDLYRLEGNLEDEIENLGLTDVWKDPKNVVVIEWAEKIKNFLPKGTKWVRFEYLGEDERRILIDEGEV